MKVMIRTVSCKLNKKILGGEFNKWIYRRGTTTIVKSKIEEHWENKMKFYMKIYEDAFGITRLTEMHDKVIEVQNNIQIMQEKRRKVQEEIFAVQKKLQESQDILRKISMSDDMYISVVTQVCELLKEQNRLRDVFSLYDQTEREQQTTLALAIKNSQDHERTYRERNKYLSLITGLIGGILGLVGSSINNWRHRKDIKHFASDISDQVVLLTNHVVDLNKTAEALKITNLSQPNTSSEATDDLISQRNGNNSVHDEHVEEIINEFNRGIESRLKKYTYANLGLSACLVSYSTLMFALFFFYITKNS